MSGSTAIPFVQRRGEVTATDAAALAPLVTTAMRVWDELGLELGELAAVTDGHPLSRLTALAATWYGAVPVLLIGRGAGGTVDVFERVSTDDPDAALKELVRRFGAKPGVAVAELTGRADAVDLLFESVPPSARVFLGGESRERLTIDFYVNVHRKGMLLKSGVLDPAADAGTDPAALLRVERARRLMARPERLAACQRALGGTADTIGA